MRGPCPRDYITDEGRALAHDRTRSTTFNAIALVFAVAVFILGFAAGQLFQQLVHDSRAYELERRV